jgi:hypothetical protein
MAWYVSYLGLGAGGLVAEVEWAVAVVVVAVVGVVVVVVVGVKVAGG